MHLAIFFLRERNNILYKCMPVADYVDGRLISLIIAKEDVGDCVCVPSLACSDRVSLGVSWKYY